MRDTNHLTSREPAGINIYGRTPDGHHLSAGGRLMDLLWEMHDSGSAVDRRRLQYRVTLYGADGRQVFPPSTFSVESGNIMSSIPGRTLEDYVEEEQWLRHGWFRDHPEALLLFEDYREAVEMWLDEFDEENQSWRDYRNYAAEEIIPRAVWDAFRLYLGMP